MTLQIIYLGEGLLLNNPNNGLGTVTVISTTPAGYKLITPDPYLKLVPISGWNSKAISISEFHSTGLVSFKLAPSAVGIVCGIVTKDSIVTEPSYSNIICGFYASNGYAGIWSKQKFISLNIKFNASDIFSIEFNKFSIHYKINNLLVYSETKQLTDLDYNLIASLFYSGDTLYDPTLIQTFTVESSEIHANNEYISKINSKNNSSIYTEVLSLGKIIPYTGIFIKNNIESYILSKKLSSIIVINENISNIKLPNIINVKNEYLTSIMQKGISLINSINKYDSKILPVGIVPIIPATILSYCYTDSYIRNLPYGKPAVSINVTSV